MSLVLTPDERKVLTFMAEVFRGKALRLRFTWPADSQRYTNHAAVIESLLARAGAEQEVEKSGWGNLPNGARIDRVLAHVRANPSKWNAALDAGQEAIWEESWEAAYDATQEANRDADLDATRDATRDATWGASWQQSYTRAWWAARRACAALVAWDEAGDLLDQPVSLVRSLAQLGVHAAVLLLPAAIAMEVENEAENDPIDYRAHAERLAEAGVLMRDRLALQKNTAANEFNVALLKYRVALEEGK